MHFQHFKDDPFFNYQMDIDSSFNNLESMFKYPAILDCNSSNNSELSKRNKESGSSFEHFFPDINSHFKAMNDMVRSTLSSFDTSIDPRDPNASFYSSSSVYECQRDLGGGGEPHIYQAHRSVRQGPGGVLEEQKAVRDTRKAEEKMAIGRYIDKKGREIERRRDMRTGEQEEHRKYHEMGESETEEFESQWESLAKKSFPSYPTTNNTRGIKGRNSYSNEGSSKSKRPAIKEGRRGRL